MPSQPPEVFDGPGHTVCVCELALRRYSTCLYNYSEITVTPAPISIVNSQFCNYSLFISSDTLHTRILWSWTTPINLEETS